MDPFEDLPDFTFVDDLQLRFFGFFILRVAHCSRPVSCAETGSRGEPNALSSSLSAILVRVTSEGGTVLCQGLLDVEFAVWSVLELDLPIPGLRSACPCKRTRRKRDALINWMRDVDAGGPRGQILPRNLHLHFDLTQT